MSTTPAPMEEEEDSAMASPAASSLPSQATSPANSENAADDPDDQASQRPPAQEHLQQGYSSASPTLDREILSRTNYIDLSNIASWTVSSAKPNYGIANIHDSSLETYWQSDGPQPHSINIHFPHLIRIQWLSIFLSFGGDESYTPSEILIRSGNGHHELLDVCTLKYFEPQGWQHVDLTRFLAANGSDPNELFTTRLLQVQVLANHQNGKDSHIRSIRIFKPRQTTRTNTIREDVDMTLEDLELSGFTGLR